jgi:hypothetical protein
MRAIVREQRRKYEARETVGVSETHHNGKGFIHALDRNPN